MSTALEEALEAGYRHIDTATVYENEAAIGKVLKKWLDAGKVKREDLFVVTKVSLFSILKQIRCCANMKRTRYRDNVTWIKYNNGKNIRPIKNACCSYQLVEIVPVLWKNGWKGLWNYCNSIISICIWCTFPLLSKRLKTICIRRTKMVKYCWTKAPILRGCGRKWKSKLGQEEPKR